MHWTYHVQFFSRFKHLYKMPGFYYLLASAAGPVMSNFFRILALVKISSFEHALASAAGPSMPKLSILEDYDDDNERHSSVMK